MQKTNLFVDNDRIYGTAAGTLYKSSLPGFDIRADNEADNVGNFSVAFNSGTETVAVSSVNLPRGPYIAFHGENMVIKTGGEEIRGNFLIRSGAIDGSNLSYGRPIQVGEKEQEALIIQATDVTVISNDLKGHELGIKLSGGIVLTKDQLVGELSGSLSYLDSTNDVDISVDQLTMGINAYVDSFTPNEGNLDSAIPGFSMSLNTKKGVFITADQFTADLGPARISGSLGLSGELLGADAALKFEVNNLEGKFLSFIKELNISLWEPSKTLPHPKENNVSPVKAIFSFLKKKAIWPFVWPGIKITSNSKLPILCFWFSSSNISIPGIRFLSACEPKIFELYFFLNSRLAPTWSAWWWVFKIKSNFLYLFIILSQALNSEGSTIETVPVSFSWIK